MRETVIRANLGKANILSKSLMDQKSSTEVGKIGSDGK